MKDTNTPAGSQGVPQGKQPHLDTVAASGSIHAERTEIRDCIITLRKGRYLVDVFRGGRISIRDAVSTPDTMLTIDVFRLGNAYAVPSLPGTGATLEQVKRLIDMYNMRPGVPGFTVPKPVMNPISTDLLDRVRMSGLPTEGLARLLSEPGPVPPSDTPPRNDLPKLPRKYEKWRDAVEEWLTDHSMRAADLPPACTLHEWHEDGSRVRLDYGPAGYIRAFDPCLEEFDPLQWKTLYKVLGLKAWGRFRDRFKGGWTLYKQLCLHKDRYEYEGCSIAGEACFRHVPTGFLVVLYGPVLALREVGEEDSPRNLFSTGKLIPDNDIEWLDQKIAQIQCEYPLS